LHDRQTLGIVARNSQHFMHSMRVKKERGKSLKRMLLKRVDVNQSINQSDMPISSRNYIKVNYKVNA